MYRKYSAIDIIQNKFARDKLFASSKASAPIKDIFYGSKIEYKPAKRWLYASFSKNNLDVMMNT